MFFLISHGVLAIVWKDAQNTKADILEETMDIGFCFFGSGERI